MRRRNQICIYKVDTLATDNGNMSIQFGGILHMDITYLDPSDQLQYSIYVHCYMESDVRLPLHSSDHFELSHRVWKFFSMECHSLFRLWHCVTWAVMSFYRETTIFLTKSCVWGVETSTLYWLTNQVRKKSNKESAVIRISSLSLRTWLWNPLMSMQSSHR